MTSITENIEDKIFNLFINDRNIRNVDTKKFNGFEIRELYKFASKFYKGRMLNFQT